MLYNSNSVVYSFNMTCTRTKIYPLGMNLLCDHESPEQLQCSLILQVSEILLNEGIPKGIPSFGVLMMVVESTV